MGVKVKRKTKNLDKLFKKLKAIDGQTVSTGYFQEQGNHPYAREDVIPVPISYATLMYMHEYSFSGGWGKVPARPVRLTVKHLISGYWWHLTKDLNKYFYGNKPLNTILDNIGRRATQMAKETFGNATVLKDNSPVTIEIKGGNTPLVDEGHLRDAWSWKTSIKNAVMST